MAQRFTESEKRDPFRNFNFKILMGGIEVAACRKMTGLEATVNVVKFRAGNSKSTVEECMPGRVEYQPVTFESGITNDKTFEDWANALVHNEFSGSDRVAEPEFRRTIDIVVMDIDGKKVMEYQLHRAWVSKYTASNDLDAAGNDVLIQTLEVTHEGFTRKAQSA